MSSSPSPSNTDRVLLTGATSFLGRAVATRLLQEGGAVHAIVRHGSDRQRLAGLPGAVVFHEHDGATESLLKIVEDAAPSVVFHIATNYIRDHSPPQVDDLVKDNILFGLQLLEAMRAAKVSRMINLGTFFQFYDSPDFRPANLYAATKQAFESILTYYRDAHAFIATTLILYDVYGPGDWRAKLMAAIRQSLNSNSPLNLVDADTIMDLVYIDDVVDVLLHVAQQGIEGGPYAVSGSQRMTLREVVGIFEKVAGKKIQTNFGAYRIPERMPGVPWIGPPVPGWQPLTTLEDGIRRFLEEAA